MYQCRGRTGVHYDMEREIESLVGCTPPSLRTLDAMSDEVLPIKE